MGFMLDLGGPQYRRWAAVSCIRHCSIAGAVPIDGLWARHQQLLLYTHTPPLVSPWVCPQEGS